MITSALDALERVSEHVVDHGNEIKNSNRQRNAEVVDLYGLQITREVGSYTTTYYGTGSLTGNQKSVAEYLSAKGLNHIQVSAIMGSMMVIGSCDPTKTDGTYYGLLAWSGNRYTQLKNWASANGSTWDALETQLDFFWLEFSPYVSSSYASNQWRNTSYYTAFMNCKSVSDAVFQFSNNWEKRAVGDKTAQAQTIYNSLESGSKDVVVDEGGTARFYISIPKDLIYFHRYEFKLVIESKSSSDISISIDGHDMTDYLYAQYPIKIGGEGIYPDSAVEENYDMLELAGDLIDEGKTEFANSLLTAGLHAIDVSSVNSFTVTMILYLKYSHTSR